MLAHIQLQCIFSYANMANPEVEPPNHINRNWYPMVLLIATKVRDPYLSYE